VNAEAELVRSIGEQLETAISNHALPARRRRVRRRRVAIAIPTVALLAFLIVASGLGSRLATASGLTESPTAALLNADLANMRAAGDPYVSLLPVPVPGETIQAFSKLIDGFDLDLVPASNGTVCFVVVNATAQLGTDHASTCVQPARPGFTHPAFAVIPTASIPGEVVGFAPPGATGVTFTMGRAIYAGRVQDGIWGVQLPPMPQTADPADLNSPAQRVGRGQPVFF
jgi:hypothetical protein